MKIDIETRVRRRLRARGRAFRGFTIIELLIVLALIGILVLIGSIEISRAAQRAKLAGVANDVRTFIAQAVNEMQKTRTGTTQYETFLVVAAQDADGTTPLRLYTDDNANGLLDIGTDTLVRSYTIPSPLILAANVSPSPVDCLYGGTGCTVATAKTQVASLNWGTLSGLAADVDKDDKTVARALRLDFRNRAISTLCPTCTATTTMIPGVAKLVLTSSRMTTAGAGRLTPLISYEIWISPVWNVTVHKGVWNGTKFVY